VTYDVVVKLTDVNRSMPLYEDRVVVDDNQTYEKTINVKPSQIGTDVKMEFLLYAEVLWLPFAVPICGECCLTRMILQFFY
jgi:hypothetical protein